MRLEHLLELDTALSEFLTLAPDSTRWRRAKWLAHLGDGPVVFGMLGLVYLLGLSENSSLLRRACVVIAIMVALAIVVVTLIKFVVRRQRPRDPGEFVTFQYDVYSFPSGHAARLAALAVSTAFFYAPLGWMLGGMAVAVGLARVAVGIHFVSDVLIGLTVGALVGWGAVVFL